MTGDLWQWLAGAAGLFLIVELLTGTFMSLSVALGLALTALYAFLFGDPGPVALVLLVAISSAVSARILRRYLLTNTGQSDVNEY